MILAARDVVVETGAVAELMRAATLVERAAIAGPAYGGERAQRPQWARWDPRGGASAKLIRGNPDAEDWAPVDWVPGALMLLSVPSMKRIGGFDPSLFAYCEDIDLCLRARRAGYRVVVAIDAHAREMGHTISSEGYIYLNTLNSLRRREKHAPKREWVRGLSRASIDAFRSRVGSFMRSCMPLRRDTCRCRPVSFVQLGYALLSDAASW
jgi:GT2 family glycosyltransferase